MKMYLIAGPMQAVPTQMPCWKLYAKSYFHLIYIHVNVWAFFA